jgi:hypothetical protein
MQGQIFQQQWCWKYENHIAFDYVEHCGNFVQDFFARTRFLFLLLDLDQEANSGTIFSFNHGFYFNDFKNTSIFYLDDTI